MVFAFGKKRLISKMEGFHFLAGQVVFLRYRDEMLDELGEDGASAHAAAMLSALFGTTPSSELEALVDLSAVQAKAMAELQRDTDLLELVVQTLRVENTLRMAKEQGLIEPSKLAQLERYGALVPLQPTPESYKNLIERYISRLTPRARQRVFTSYGITGVDDVGR